MMLMKLALGGLLTATVFVPTACSSSRTYFTRDDHGNCIRITETNTMGCAHNKDEIPARETNCAPRD